MLFRCETLLQKKLKEKKRRWFQDTKRKTKTMKQRTTHSNT